MKKIILSLLFGAMALTGVAQETIYQVDEVSVINYGDGRLLFRQLDENKSPLNGQHRIIDGYRSEYVLADFKDGMYNGNFQHFKSNKLKEEGTYKEGRKEGIYKEYYSDGSKVKKSTPYKEGKLNGIVTSYYTDGKPEKEKEYSMSVENGIERSYNYETGNISERNYKDGLQHGSQVIYYSSNVGAFVELSNFDNGKRVGEFLEIFTDVSLKTLGYYNKEGRKDGEWLERDSFSAKDNDKFSGRRIIYQNGEVVGQEEIKNFVKFQRRKWRNIGKISNTAKTNNLTKN